MRGGVLGGYGVVPSYPCLEGAVPPAMGRDGQLFLAICVTPRLVPKGSAVAGDETLVLIAVIVRL